MAGAPLLFLPLVSLLVVWPEVVRWVWVWGAAEGVTVGGGAARGRADDGWTVVVACDNTTHTVLMKILILRLDSQ